MFNPNKHLNKFDSFNDSKKSYIHILLIILSATLIYANSIHVPFIFDDFATIRNNFYIRPPVNIGWIWDSHANRFVSMLSYALSYSIHKYSVEGYHIGNIIIHSINGILVFSLLKTIFQLRHFQNSIVEKYSHIISLCAALLFVSHPIQVNAVTYITQRDASLAATFYILSIILYINFRCKHKFIYFILTVATTVIAMNTKESTITIPIMLTLFEFMFFFNRKEVESIKRRIYVFFLYFIMLIIPFVNIFRGGTFKASTDMDRMIYFYSEQNVILRYIKLLFLPYGQVFDYGNGFGLSHSLWENYSYISFAILLIIGCIGIFNFRKNKLISLGILWFFIGLSVESSFISINDVYFEHRLYFPVVGFFLVLIGIFSLIVDSKKELSRTGAINVFVLISLVLFFSYSSLTIYRNYIFGDTIRLWIDVTGKAPGNSRAHIILGEEYMKRFVTISNTTLYDDVFQLTPGSTIPSWSTESKKYLALASNQFEFGLNLSEDYNYTFYENLVKIYYLQGEYKKCIQIANENISLYNANPASILSYPAKTCYLLALANMHIQNQEFKGKRRIELPEFSKEQLKKAQSQYPSYSNNIQSVIDYVYSFH